MTLLTIIISISAPTLSHFFRGRAIDSEARRMLSLTRYGQSRAVSEGVPMVLWIDEEQKTYGLQTETGFAEDDAKSVQYDLAKGLEVQITLPIIKTKLPMQVATKVQGKANVPTIRFSPEGYLGESSPERIQIRETEREGEDSSAIDLVPSRNRLNYEISTNAVRDARR